MSVLIIDYDMGNLGSVVRSFEECGAHVIVSEDPKELNHASHVVLPGVGSFHDGMENLVRRGWIGPMRDAVEEGAQLLGICLGMQLLADKGYEGGEVKGLGFVPGEVRRLHPETPDERIPHVGWNEVHESKPCFLFADIASGTDFYFVHSYHFIPGDDHDVVATTPYCGRFVSVVMRRNALGVQFHPEKSSKPGLQLIRNFLTA